MLTRDWSAPNSWAVSEKSGIPKRSATSASVNPALHLAMVGLSDLKEKSPIRQLVVLVVFGDALGAPPPSNSETSDAS